MEVGTQVIVELCRVFDVFRMPAEWALSLVVPIFNGKADIMNCCCYRARKLLEHGMKEIERMLEKCFID